MEWCKLYGRYFNDAAIVAVGEDGEVLFVRALAWAADNDTEGFVPTWQLERFGLKRADKRAAKLVAEELWTVGDGGWQITNYAKWQAEAKSIEKRRKADRTRKQSQRHAQKSTGHSADVPPDSPQDIPQDSSRISPVVVNDRDEIREPRGEKPRTDVTGRSARLAAGYAAKQPLTNRYSVQSVVAQAIGDGGYDDAAVAAALGRLADARMPVTQSTLLVELNGPPRKTSTTNSRVGQALDLAEKFAQQEANLPAQRAIGAS